MVKVALSFSGDVPLFKSLYVGIVTGYIHWNGCVYWGGRIKQKAGEKASLSKKKINTLQNTIALHVKQLLITKLQSQSTLNLTVEMTTQLVDDQGRFNVRTTELEELITGKRRFPIITQADAEHQLDDNRKYIRRLALEPFRAVTEEQLEDWLDLHAGSVMANRVCVQIFQEAWIAVCPPGIAMALGSIEASGTHEELIDEIAKVLFRHSRYFFDLEKEIFLGKRHGSVMEAEFWLREKLARYERLARRHSHDLGLSDTRLREVFLSSLPVQVEVEVRRIRSLKAIKEQIKEAAAIEAEVIRVNGTLSVPMGVMTAMEIDDDNEKGGRLAKRQHVNGRSPNECISCGGKGHWRKDCMYKDYRCRECNEVGHISRVCRNHVTKDNKGRVTTLVRVKPGSTEAKLRSDRTQADKLTSAESVLQLVKDMAARRAARAVENRKVKQKQKGWIPKRETKDHPVNLVEEESQEASSVESGDEKDLSSLMGSFGILAVTEADFSETFQIKARINGRDCRVLADTAAARSICNMASVKEFGLKPTSRRKRFRGLGIVEGYACEDVVVGLNGKEAEVEFYAIDYPGFPTVISKRDLAKFRVLLDPATEELVDKGDEAPVAVAWEQSTALAEKAPSLELIKRPEMVKSSDSKLLVSGKEIMEKLLNHINDDDMKCKIWNLFQTYSKCWLRPRPGSVKEAATVNITGKPVRQKLRHLNEELKKVLEDHISPMLESGVIEPSSSPWGSCPVFVKKRDGNWRMCLDYRQVNKQIEDDAYPIPLILDGLEQAAHHNYYSTFDLQWGFWNVPLEESCRPVTAMITHLGTYQFRVLPFGLKTSPASFQRAMDGIFGDLYGEGVFVYFDDIVIYTDTADEMLSKIETFLHRACAEGLCLRLSKSNIMKSKVALLGHVVSTTGITRDPEKLNAVLRATIPDSKDTLRSFLGTVGYLRRFIPHFAAITSPLTDLLKKNTAFNWNEDAQEAFETLKVALVEEVALSAPTGQGPFVIVTDASDRGVGCGLLQLQQGKLVLLGFGSRKLTPAEKKWDTREREAFGIKWAVEHFRDYVQAGKVYVLTDHESLRWMDTANSGKVQRWALYLQQFNLEIMYIAGQYNLTADWLSRSLPDDPEIDDQIETMAVPAFVAESEVVTAPALPPIVPRASDFVNGYKEMTEDELKDSTKGGDGLRYGIRNGRLFVPTDLRNSIIHWFHSSRFGCHCGINRTLRRMRKWVYWPQMHSDVARYINNCLPCLRFTTPKSSRLFTEVLTRPLPMQLISIDYVGPRPWGNKRVYYCVIIDHCTRYLQAFPAENPTAAAIIVALSCWTDFMQAPEAILTDRGSVFNSNEFTTFVTLNLTAHHVFTSPYYPRGNGINEACHQGLEKSLKIADSECMSDTFNQALRDAVAVHNATPNMGTGESPYCSLFGFEPTLPGWQFFRRKEDASVRKATMREHRHHQLIRSQINYEELKVSPLVLVLKPGDWVVYELSDYERKAASKENPTTLTSSKYLPSWSLPSKVLEVKDKVVIVQLMGQATSSRQVPINNTRRLTNPLSDILFNVNLRHIERNEPRFLRHRKASRSKISTTWDDVIRTSTTRAEGPMAKRQERAGKI